MSKIPKKDYIYDILLTIAGPIGTMFTVAQKLSEKMLFLIYEKAISIKK